MSEIVKVQRPMSTNDPLRPWCIYARGRSRVLMVPEADVPAKIVEMMGGHFKRYFTAVWDGVAWGLLEPAEDQPW